MPTIRDTRLFALPVAALLLHGCAAAPAREATTPEAPPGPLSYTVRDGDRLGEIALELTGELSNWREIAAHNGIDDPRALRVGSVLEIPLELLPATPAPIEGTETGDAGTAALAEATGDTSASEDGAALDEGGPVTLAPVRVNRDFELSPMSLRTVGSAGAPAAVAGFGVRVLGSYYPKGVYAEPSDYGRLLLRVAPGTVLEFVREVGDWYGIRTETGVGYLRRVDGLLLDTPEAAQRPMDETIHG